MATTSTTGLYEFDPYGNSPDNLIVDEGHALQVPGRDDYYFIIPKAAPFFATTLEVMSSSRVLYTEGVDYLIGHTFVEATGNTGKVVAGSIRFLRRDITGMVYLKYQTLGGEWGFDKEAILQELSNKLVNPLIRSWGQIDVLPNAFPPVPHDQSVDEIIGFPEVTTSLEHIREAIEAAAAGATSDHINNRDNPHQVTKAQVGLGNVENYPVATVLEATEASRNDRYLTPSRGRILTTKLAIEPLNAHLVDVDNPHQVTKAQVGLGNVENLPKASILDTVLGTSDVLYTTPKGVREAIDNVMNTTASDHYNDHSNPHQVTKAQVGLGNVENYPVADLDATVIGDSNTMYTTPRGVREAIMNAVGGEVSDHFIDYNNPHGTTKAHVGLSRVVNYGVANIQATIAGTSDNEYTTPKGVKEAIYSALGGGDAGAHFTNYENPHQVTAAQVGTLTESQINSLLDGKLDDNDPSVDALKVYGLNKTELLGEISDLTVANSSKFGGVTFDEFLGIASSANITEQFMDTVPNGNYVCLIQRDYSVDIRGNVVYAINYTGTTTGVASGVLVLGKTKGSVQIQMFNDTEFKPELYISEEDDVISIWAQSTGEDLSVSFYKLNGGDFNGVYFPDLEESPDMTLPSLAGLGAFDITVEYPLNDALMAIADAFNQGTAELT